MNDILLMLRSNISANNSSISRGKFGQTTNRDHDIEQCHFVSVGYSLRLLRFSDDTDLLVEGPGEFGDYDRDDRITDIFGESLLEISRQFGRSLTGRLDIFNQGNGYATIRANGDFPAQVVIAPNKELQHVAGANPVVRAFDSGSHCGGGAGTVAGATGEKTSREAGVEGGSCARGQRAGADCRKLLRELR